MRKASREFLFEMLQQPSPSGYEGPVREVWQREAARHADRVEVDLHGNVIAVHNPEGQPRIMLAGHMDELGFQVVHISDDGYLYFDTIGGFDLSTVPARSVQVHARGGPVDGVIGKKPVHLMASDERRRVLEKQDLWIDIGAKDGKEARKLVEIGDPVTYRAEVGALRHNLIVSRGLDNKMGAWLAAETLRSVSRHRRRCRAALYAVATVQEEVGLRGARTSAYGIDPRVGIGLDVTWATDHPGMDKRKVGDIRLGGGPVITRGANINPVVFARLREAAECNKIPYQIDAAPGGTGTDANAIQLSRAGVAAGLVSVPQRYMHTPVETISTEDLDNTVKLLTAFVVGLDGKTDFTP